jgi:hypothetical protein
MPIRLGYDIQFASPSPGAQTPSFLRGGSPEYEMNCTWNQERRCRQFRESLLPIIALLRLAAAKTWP